VLANLLLLTGGAALVAALRRSNRVAAIVACGLVAAGAVVFVQAHVSTAQADTTVGAAELAQARRAYFERVIATFPPTQVVADRTRADAVRWFRGAHLGMFVHYGPTSTFAAASDREWWRAVDAGRFDAAARAFRPRPEVVTQWVAQARSLGANYLTVTAKHHDGFGLWDSKLTGWDVGPQRDLLAPLAREAQRHQLPLFVYYSLLDRHEPTYAADKDAYLVFVEGQLRELLTQYGPLAGVWFDGWNRDFGTRRLQALYRLVHTLQPWALVGTNHHLAVLPGEDFKIYENVFPGVPSSSATPSEIAVKLGATWFWGGRPVPLERVPSLLRRSAALHANLLVDVPPRADGTFPPARVATITSRRTRSTGRGR
jgi:alpha-L-fucosidase